MGINNAYMQANISIHTSPKGGDPCGDDFLYKRIDFNPHLPEGR